MQIRPYFSDKTKIGFTQSFRIVGTVLAILLGSIIKSHSAEIASTNSTQQILQMQTFREGLVWIGNKEPTEAENKELLEVLTHLNEEWWTAGVEQFLQDYPHSPWAASLRHDYASFCRRTGRTTTALDQWQAAWEVVKDDNSAQGQKLAGTILANWMDLLSSLGRLEKLKELVAVGDQRNFINPADRDKFEGAKNSYFLMQMHPEIAYRCGTFALKAIGEKLHSTNILESLVEIPSPTNGFSMAALVDIAKQYGLNMVPVRRSQGQDLIVPSVVHWRQNHYAAILEREGDNYLVNDPTFGSEKWMPADIINQEASGEFLIPTTSLANGWKRLALKETKNIHGMGLPDNIKDGNDKGKHPICPGMPTWFVTEPYINLWLADEPISYLTSRGEPFTFRITYKQRDTVSSVSPEIAAGGIENSWYSFIYLINVSPCPSGPPPIICNMNFYKANATLFLPNGGEVFYPFSNFNSDPPVYDAETRTTLQPQAPTVALAAGFDNGRNGLQIVHADGSRDIYGYGFLDAVVAGDYREARFYLTRHIDLHGDTTWFNYGATNNIIVLKSVVDCDGLTNTLKYNSSGTQLIEVDNPYGAKAQFKYDASGNLTNIIDAQGLTSGISYDANNYPKTLTTPYGTTQFSVFINATVANTNNGQGNFGGHNLIDRSVQVTDPVGANYLYLYRYDSSSFMSSSFSSSDVPTSTPVGTLDSGTNTTANLAAICYRNSFYWGPRQFAGLSTTNTSSFTANDYLCGRMKHWLEDQNQLYLSGYLSVERDSSPDGSTEGLKTFYDYIGKLAGYNFCAGSYPLPSVTAWRMPNGETHYQYQKFDYFGNVTNSVSTYTLSGGSVGTRTNQFIYADNNYTNYFSDQPNGGHVVATYVFTVPNLLTKIIAPDGSVIWSCGGFDVVAYSNNFQTVSSTTNSAIFYSKRVLPDNVTNAVGDVSSFSYGSPMPVKDYYYNTNYFATGFSGYNKITSITSFAGLTITNFYNANGFLTQTIDLQIGRTNSFGYTGNGLIGAFTNELGLNVSATWDNLLRLTSAHFPDGTYVSNRFDRLVLGGVRDRLGNWTTYGHDGARHLTSITNANNAVTLLSWCGCGSLTDILDPLNNDTSLYYDNQGNLTNVNFPDGSKLFYQYDLAARRTSVADGASRTWLFGYNNQGLVTVISNTYGKVQGTFYDIRDRQVSVTNEDGIVVTNSFDPLDRILTRTWPNSATEGFSYSAQGIAFYTNQLNQVTKFGYDAAMRKIAETNANNEVSLFTYDAASDLLTLTDGKNQTTTWTYDLFGNVSNKVDAANNLLFVYKYDSDGRLTNRLSAAKGATTYTYDAVGNLTNIVYPVSPAIVLTYDPLNRLTNMVDAVGTTAFTYSQVGQLLSEDGPWANDTVSYTYSQELRATLGLSQPSGSWSQTYSYDNARRLTGLTSPAGTFGYSYFAPASVLPVSVTLPNSAYITNTYDTLARLTGTYLKNSGNTVLDSQTYAYDTGNERTQQVFMAGNFINYGYDQIGQLKAAVGKESGGTTSRLQEQLGYGYDTADNLNLRTNNALVQTFNVNNLNELTTITNKGTLTVAGTTTVPATSVTVNGSTANHYADATFALGGFTVTNGINGYTAIGTDVAGNKGTNSITVNLPATNTYAYDLNGNLLTNGNEVLVWNDENELVTNFVAGSWKSEFVYDGLLRRRIERDYSWNGSAWTQTNEIRFIYDGDVVIQHRDTNNLPTLTLTRGLDLSGELQDAGGIGGLLAMTESSGTSSYYHADGAGNVMMLINTNQLMVAKAEYEPYGNFLSLSGPKASINPYWYSSKPIHWQSGKYDFLYRWYVPDLDRFANRDPIQEMGGINLYNFVGNSPMNYGDPLGLYGFSDYKRDFGDGWNMVKSGVGKGLTSAEEFFTGKPGDYQADPNSIQYLSNQAGVGVTPLTDKDGNCVDATKLVFTGVFLSPIVALIPGGEEAELINAGRTAKAAKDVEEVEKIGNDVKLLNTARNNLLNAAQNPRLKNAIDNLYRPGAKLGNGSSMDALRIEGTHLQKLFDRQTQLLNILREENLNARDTQITKDLLNDIQNAITEHYSK